MIVPSSNDVNQGDQALGWETISCIEATGLVDNIALLGSTEAHNSREQPTRALGSTVFSSILNHPRRGRNRPEDRVREGRISLILMIINSLIDLTRSQLLLLLAPFPAAARLMLNTEQRKTYIAFLDARAVFVRGGGFLHAYGGLTAPYQMWYSLFYMRLANRLKIPVIVMPNSFGPFIGLGVKRQVKNVLSKCAFISARETVSAKALGSLLGRDVPVYPDLGYFLTPSDPDVGIRICREFGVPVGEKRCVGLTVRPYRFPGCVDPASSYQRYLDAFAALVKHVESLGYYPVFITQVSGPSAHETDALAISDLVGRINCSHAWVDFRGTCRDLKAVYGCMEYVVGTRFHSVVFAQGLQVPSIAVAYGGNKATGIMGDMGLGDYVVPIDQVTGEGLCSMFDRLVSQSENLKQSMRDWLAEAAERRNEMIRDIHSALSVTLPED